MGTGASRRRFGPATAAAAAGLLLGALLTGCGSSSSASRSASAPAKVTAADLTRAADVSTDAAGFKTVMTVTETIPGLGNVTLKGGGSFQEASRAGSMTMNMSLPATATAGLGNGSMQFVLVLDRSVIYAKLPAVLTAALAGAKQWIEIDLSQLGKSPASAGLSSSLMNGFSQMSDPGQYFNYLRAITTGSLQDLGAEAVDGVQTTHYHAAIDLAKLPSVVPAAQRSAIEKLVAMMPKGSSAVQIDVWVDSDNLVRRTVVSEVLSVDGRTETINARQDYPEYGPQPPPVIPPASDVTNISSLIAGSL